MVAIRKVHPAPGEAIYGERKSNSGLWLLAVLPVLAIPFEEQFSLFGFSLAKLVIIPLLIGVIFILPGRLFVVCKHPVFLCGIGFVAWGAIVEATHPYSDWNFLYSLFQSFIFAALFATVCSNPVVFRRVLIAIAIVCSFLALYFIYNFYGLINIDVTGWREAGSMRDQAFRKTLAMDSGLNILAYTVGMGAIVALTKLLMAKRNLHRIFWGAIYALCAVGSFVPLSRGSFVALVLASILVLWRSSRQLLRPGTMFLFIGITVLVFMSMPQALTERYASLRPEEDVVSRKVEGRNKIYMAAVESIPQYWAVGVGTGQYWKEWAMQNGFGRQTPFGPAVVGPHNGFLTAWIFFGLPGLVLLCLICFFAARNCPKRDNKSLESVVLFGLLGLGFIWIMFTHTLYLKSFAVILGLLMGVSIKRANNRMTRGSRPLRSIPIGANNIEPPPLRRRPY